MSDDRASVDAGAVSASRFPTWILALALLLLAAGAYSNAVMHPFVYDDEVLVLKNPRIRELSNVPSMIGLGENGVHLRTRWTRDVTYAIEYAAAGTRAPVYHATNIALHGLVGILVFTLIAGVSGRRLLGFWTAALFVVHPINTEVVAQVAGRRELLAAAFSLLALLLLERYTRRGGVLHVVAAGVCVYLGVFSKELAVMTPIVFCVMDTFRRRPEEGTAGCVGAAERMGLADHLRRRLPLYAGLAVLTLGLAALRLFGTDDVGLAGSPSYYETTTGGLGAVDRAGLLGLGIRLLFVPVGQTVDYSFDALGFANGGRGLAALLDLALLLAALGATVWGLARRSWIGIGGAWLFLYLLPHSGIIPWHEVFAERFLYLSAIGFCLAVAWVGLNLAQRPGLRSPAVAAGLAALSLLGAATLLRNQVWSSEQALWEAAVERYPLCARAHKALGDVYLEDSRPEFALQHFQEAVRLLPAYLDASVGVAASQTALRDYGSALQTLDRVLGRWAEEPKALNLKGYIQQTLGDADAALASYQRAVDSDPRFAEGYNNLARMYVERGDLDTAVRMYEKALEVNPAFVAALQNLAVVYRNGFEDEEKAAYYESLARQLLRNQRKR